MVVGVVVLIVGAIVVSGGAVVKRAIAGGVRAGDGIAVFSGGIALLIVRSAAGGQSEYQQQGGQQETQTSVHIVFLLLHRQMHVRYPSHIVSQSMKYTRGTFRPRWFFLKIKKKTCNFKNTWYINNSNYY